MVVGAAMSFRGVLRRIFPGDFPEHIPGFAKGLESGKWLPWSWCSGAARELVEETNATQEDETPGVGHTP